MKPISYTRRGDKITYHYTFTQLREFITHGFKEGNNGVIMVAQDDRFTTYRGFGTIENPWTYIATIEMEHDPIYDGEMTDPEDIINPPKLDRPYSHASFFIWDAGKIHRDDGK